MVECHRKQFRAIMEARTDVRIAKEGIEGNSTVKAIQKLETEILNWATGFTDWLNTQKAFLKYLNGWLMKCLLQEPEDTLDGTAPFSPRRLGAPPIFIILNDWFHAIENVSETDVSKAMRDFASMLHHLGEKLIEERHLRLKVEFLSKDLEKQVKTLYEESGINWDQFITSNNTADLEGITENAVLIPGGVYVKFETMRNRLDEEKAKHEETIKQLDDAASQGFRAGLIRIFEALDTFSLDMLKAYEQVRTRSGEVQSEV